MENSQVFSSLKLLCSVCYKDVGQVALGLILRDPEMST